METTLMTLDRHEDNRGEFMQIWQDGLRNTSTNQINVSISNKGTLRGLHFQNFRRQKKLLTVLKGSIIDIVMDIRPHSESFGKFNFIHLNKGDQFLVPDTCAHGFLSLQEETIVMYQVNRTRVASEEMSIYAIDPEVEHFEDKNMNLNKFILNQMMDHETTSLTLSQKDNNATKFKHIGADKFDGMFGV